MTHKGNTLTDISDASKHTSKSETQSIEGEKTPAQPNQKSAQGKFVSGSTMQHVIKMTVTGSIGLMAIFSVDLLTLLYISMLKDDALTAGVGFSGLINFFAISINIGLIDRKSVV